MSLAGEINYPSLYTSKIGNGLYEIGEIKITGNTYLTDEEIYSILLSMETSRSPLHEIFNFYYNQIEKNPYSNDILPDGLTPSLKEYINKWDDELPFFNYNFVVADSINLREYYRQNGFHQAQIDFRFYPDSSAKSNVLEFIIEENSRYYIKSLTYFGLDSLDQGTSDRVFSLKKIRPGRQFTEKDVSNEANSILNELRNSGYFYARIDSMKSVVDLDNKTDSVMIVFTSGQRQRIASVKFVDSLNEQHVVTDKMKERQLEFKIGDWYNRRNIERSRDNLYNLGTFEVVFIDTTSKFVPQTDTTLSLIIRTSYRKQKDWGTGLFINQSTVTGNINSGFDVYFLHRNIFGNAQSFNPYAKLEFQNVNDFSNITRDFLGQVGFKFAQPLLWTIDKARIGFSWNPNFTRENLLDELSIYSFSSPIKFPVKLPPWVYFQYFSFDILVEQEIPIDFDNVYSNALGKAGTADDSAFVKNSLRQYKTLKENSTFPSAFIAGFSFIGDKRDHPFLPESGYFINLTYDGWAGLGIAKYFRPQLTYYNFFPVTGNAVLGIKAKGGYIIYNDEQNDQYYVPHDKQFYAGGANSVRGWQSRRLRYEADGSITENESRNSSFIQDYIGSAMLIEGTAELRIRVPRQRNINRSIKEFLENIEFTTFVDLGNTFHWFAEEYKGYTIEEYVKGLGISYGAGIGYITPIGPFRVDLAIPVVYPRWKQTIFTKYNAMKELKFHIGIGHSF